MRQEGQMLYADDGKMLRRISDKRIFGESVFLGKTWYINNTRLTSPLQEIPEHYEEVSEEDLAEEAREVERSVGRKQGDKIDSLIRERYTLSEELAILRQKDEKPEEWAEYYAYAEECKRRVKENWEFE